MVNVIEQDGLFLFLFLFLGKLLANRDQDVRDTTRKTLVQITKKLGVNYVHVVLRQMKMALHSGFMVHVLSYSVHAVLRAMYGDNKRIERHGNGEKKKGKTSKTTTSSSSSSSNGEDAMEIDNDDGEELDDVSSSTAVQAPTLPMVPSPIDINLTHIIPILDDDIFGRVAQQRNSEDYRPRSALIEAKTCKSYDSFELLARSLTFLPCLSIHVLVSPMVDKLDGAEELADKGYVFHSSISIHYCYQACME